MKAGIVTQRGLVWGLLVLLAAGGAFAVWVLLGGRLLWAPGSSGVETFGSSAASPQSRGVLEKLEVYGRVPDFSLTERSGRRVALADLVGKVWIANFIYTECTDTCPLQSANLARLQAEFAGEPDLMLVSISVDPEHDTPKILMEYASRFQAAPERWLFLTGPRDTIYRLAIEGFRLGVVDQGEKVQQRKDGGRAWFGPLAAWAHPVPNPDRKPILHSSRFVLVDRQGQIRGYYHGTDEESLARLRRAAKTLLRRER